MTNKRTDADRRLPQCERLSRLLRVLRLILGPGRWDTDALAEELECSRRTIQRDLQTLLMAGVPWYFDNATGAYRVRPGFRFPAVERAVDAGSAPGPMTAEVRAAASRLLDDGERLVESLRTFRRTFREMLGDGPTDKAANG